MRWSCKSCNFRTATRLDLLRHYRLKHSHTRPLPCLFSDCPCCFKSWGALKTHLSRDHPESEQSGKIVSFKCLVCNLCNFHTEKQYFEHLGSHLKKHKTIHCVFKGCSYSTYIYTTFASHKSRKHTSHCLEDFKETILQTFPSQATDDDCSLVDNNCRRG